MENEVASVGEMTRRMVALVNGVPIAITGKEYSGLVQDAERELTDWKRDIEQRQREMCWQAVEKQGKELRGGWPTVMDTYVHRDAILSAGKEE